MTGKTEPEDLFLGVDGGQSRTKAAVGDRSGQVVGRGEAGPCNHVGAAQGREKLVRALSEAVGQALAEAGRDLSSVRFAAAVFGMSGGPDDKRQIIAETVASRRLEVTTDADIALWGGTGGAPGIVVIAGTGSMAFGRNAIGKTARAGGWGYLFGDEGGGFDVVRQALRAALKHHEGWGPATSLESQLVGACNATDAHHLMHLFYTEKFPRSLVAALAGLVDTAAAQGDPVSRGILRDAAHSLAELAAAVRGNLFAPGDSVQVVYTGGVFHSSFILEEFRNRLERSGKNHVMPPRFEPALGALLGAYRLAGVEIDLTPTKAR
jgi:N-acetylglucosamine kinase-like BadF-type ATPase